MKSKQIHAPRANNESRQRSPSAPSVESEPLTRESHDLFILQETYKSQMSVLQEGLKILAWTNGGAAIATLSLIGALVGRCMSLPAIVPAATIFASGLAACILGFFLAYFTQLQLTMAISTREKKWMRFQKITYWIAAVLVLTSVSAFVAGIVVGSTEFVAFKCAPAPASAT